MELVVGFLLGLVASFLVWFYVARLLVPDLKFDSQMYCDNARQDASPVYRIRFRNAGRRPLIDLEVIVKLRLKGLRPDFPGLWQAVYVPVDDDRVPVVPPQPPGYRRAVRLLPDEIDAKYLEVLAAARDISTSQTQGLLDLRRLLTHDTDNSLEVYAFCYDAFSGSRKLFTKIYRATDLVPESQR